jgi:hypothetical protein
MGMTKNMTSIAYAQVASIDQRLRIGDTSRTEPTAQSSLPTTVGTVTNYDRLRLIQLPTPTYILVALLSIITLINMFASLGALAARWGPKDSSSSVFLDMTMRNVAPGSSGSIAAMARLLADSNILEAIPERTNKVVASRALSLSVFGGFPFRMGWFQSSRRPQPMFTVG